ncbi:MAG: AAA family ATPase [Bacteroidales bacterium]|jgi:hypothetical protein|nr:AAA family ATPase [Bacteroidales bacterium]
MEEKEELQQLYNVYNKFKEKFPLNELENLTLEEYTNLVENTKDSFCYWLEHETEKLGHIGGTPGKNIFGIIRRKKSGKYDWSKKYGTTQEEAFKNIKDIIIKIASFSQKEEFEEIDKIGFGEICKWKIAFMYAPQGTLVNVFKKECLLEVAKKLGMVCDEETKMSDLQKYIISKKDIDKDIFEYGNEIWNSWNNQEKIINDDYIKFKQLLEYFVAHLEYVQTKNEMGKGFEKYIKPIRNNPGFKQGGQGYNGGNIQNQISQWDNYRVGKICINIYTANYKSVATYLNWKDTGINVVPVWNNDDIVKLSLVLYIDKDNREPYNIENTIEELGLFDDKEPNDCLKSFFYKYVSLYEEFKTQETQKNMKEIINKATKLLETKKNIILQGAPGTGKTYNTAAIALSIIGEDISKFSNHEDLMEKYENLRKERQIEFVTFHQSMDYEDFVEGIKPIIKGDNVSYEVKNGIFKQICTNAKNEPKKNYVLIIDEINRGNVSKIFGDLITLLENDKRIGGEHEIRVKLPYSSTEDNTNDFGVPSNLYIIGTMNTTDRSTGTIDYAVRRRFAFITLPADENCIEDENAKKLFENVKGFIEKNNACDMDIDDLMVGHSYFMAEKEGELKLKMEYEVIPLIKEYIKDGILNKDEEQQEYFNAWKNAQTYQETANNQGVQQTEVEHDDISNQGA